MCSVLNTYTERREVIVLSYIISCFLLKTLPVLYFLCPGTGNPIQLQVWVVFFLITVFLYVCTFVELYFDAEIEKCTSMIIITLLKSTQQQPQTITQCCNAYRLHYKGCVLLLFVDILYTPCRFNKKNYF